MKNFIKLNVIYLTIFTFLSTQSIAAEVILPKPKAYSCKK